MVMHCFSVDVDKNMYHCLLFLPSPSFSFFPSTFFLSLLKCSPPHLPILLPSTSLPPPPFPPPLSLPALPPSLPPFFPPSLLPALPPSLPLSIPPFLSALPDMGNGQPDDSRQVGHPGQQPALNTTRLVLNQIDQTDLVLHIGDISYARGYASVVRKLKCQVC